ncbi:MAG: nicotinamide mononucleotide transporter, partial [Bacteroidales bacterium]|nr:nicotinamide mononucleotide transporter [Bacteroidales bacterium]
VSMGLYIYKGLYPTVVLFAVYTIMAVIGYFEWRRTIDRNNGDGGVSNYSPRMPGP